MANTMNNLDWKTEEVHVLEDQYGVEAAWDPEKSGGISYQFRQGRDDAMDKVISPGRSSEESLLGWQEHFGDLFDACNRARDAWLMKTP